MSLALDSSQADQTNRLPLRQLRFGASCPRQIAIGILVAIEFCGFLLAAFASLLVLAISLGHFPFVTRALFWAITLSVGLVLVLGINQAKLLDPDGARSLRDRAVLIACYHFGTFATVFVISRIAVGAHHLFLEWLLLAMLLSVPLMLGIRSAFWASLRPLAIRNIVSYNVAVVGAGPDGAAFVDLLSQRKNPLLQIIGVFDDRARSDSRGLPGQLQEVAVRGTTADLLAFAKRVRIDAVIIAMPWTGSARVQELLSALRPLAASIYLAPDAASLSFLDNTLASMQDLPAFHLAQTPVDGWSHLTKWAFDKTLALVALTLLFPVLVVAAIAIKLDSDGPILFKQRRYGFNGRIIHIYKFRTMYHHTRDSDASRLVSRDDPRVTRVGHFLRRTSLDELPQLLNVMRGDMSIVGPRPHALQAKAGGQLYQDVVSDYALRHRIKPGITGWAQIHGWRGETDTADKVVRRVECDLYYIEHWSLLLDFYIVIVTALILPFQRNAY